MHIFLDREINAHFVYIEYYFLFVQELKYFGLGLYILGDFYEKVCFFVYAFLEVSRQLVFSGAGGCKRSPY
jgi:hypothetical protein